MNRCDEIARRRQTMRSRWGLIGVLLAASAGCSRGEFPLAPVAGRVTFDGKPLAGGSVVFQPIAAAGETSAGRGSFGYCDEDGNFSLETVDGQPGAVIAEHRVRICAARTQTASKIDGGDPKASEYREPVPARYNSETELTFAVSSDGSTDANFDLTSN